MEICKSMRPWLYLYQLQMTPLPGTHHTTFGKTLWHTGSRVVPASRLTLDTLCAGMMKEAGMLGAGACEALRAISGSRGQPPANNQQEPIALCPRSSGNSLGELRNGFFLRQAFKCLTLVSGLRGSKWKTQVSSAQTSDRQKLWDNKC